MITNNLLSPSNIVVTKEHCINGVYFLFTKETLVLAILLFILPFELSIKLIKARTLQREIGCSAFPQGCWCQVSVDVAPFSFIFLNSGNIPVSWPKVI